MGSVIPLKKEIDNSYLRLKNLVGGKLEEVVKHRMLFGGTNLPF